MFLKSKKIEKTLFSVNFDRFSTGVFNALSSSQTNTVVSFYPLFFDEETKTAHLCYAFNGGALTFEEKFVLTMRRI